MSFRVNTNISAMNGHRNTTINSVGLAKSLNSLGSGLRVNKAADDASGISLANKLSAQSQGLGQAIRNSIDGIGLVQTADGALEEYGNILKRIRTLAIEAANDTQDADSRNNIRLEANALLSKANEINDTTAFNGVKILNGSGANNGVFTFHTGAYTNETQSVNIASNSFSTITQFVGNDITMSNQAYAENIISAMDLGIKNLDAKRATLGAAQNKLESTLRNISVTQVNVEAAQSQIRDVDFASESANFSKHNILAQSGSYAMSQANAKQQNVMRLFQ